MRKEDAEGVEEEEGLDWEGRMEANWGAVATKEEEAAKTVDWGVALGCCKEATGAAEEAVSAARWVASRWFSEGNLGSLCREHICPTR